MALGTKLKQARLALGMSQRALCGDRITRNMLSQIENETARPSMETLQYLAERLDKPVGFFLEEKTSESLWLGKCREAYREGDWQEALEAVGEDTRGNWEAELIRWLAALEVAQQAAEEGRQPYALRLLEELPEPEGYASLLAGRRKLLLAKLRPEMAVQLPPLDEELLVRAGGALQTGDGARAAAYLDAAEHRDTEKWFFLRGQAALLQGDHAAAAEFLSRGQNADLHRSAALLETCYREMGDFKMAYHYACIRRSEEGGV